VSLRLFLFLVGILGRLMDFGYCFRVVGVNKWYNWLCILRSTRSCPRN